MYFNGFTCYRCGAFAGKDLVGMVCPHCGGNLEVRYDYDALRKVVRDELARWQTREDIFRYLPLLPVKDTALASPLRVGHTPLYACERLGKHYGLDHLFIKDDGLNPTSSFKDRAGAVALVKAREDGFRVIAGASTGNAGSSMAGLCASVGQPCVVFVPESAPPAKLIQLRSYGAQVVAVRGTYDDAFDLCVEMCQRHGWFNRNTGMNPFTREGKKTCSLELWEQFANHAPDRIVVSAGDGNIISGIWKGWQDLQRAGLVEHMPKLDVVQATGSAAIVRTIQRLRDAGTHDHANANWREVEIEPVKAETMADSISVDMPRDGLAAVRAVMESGGHAITVSDDQIRAAEIELASQAGIFTEPASAAAWAGIVVMAQRSLVTAGESIVCLLTGNGLKDAGKIVSALPPLTVVDPVPAAAEKVLRDLI
jgi:threonine synthase